jgi:hypothetical protein
MFVTCTRLPAAYRLEPAHVRSKTEQFVNYLFSRIILHENTKKKKRHDVLYTGHVRGDRGPSLMQRPSIPTGLATWAGREINNG